MEKKLKSQNGASILMAMVLFLICGFVAAVTLGSAVTNAQKYTNQRRQQQSYLSISSAARMLKEMLDGKKFIGVEEKWIYECRAGLSGYSGIDNFEEDRFEVCGRLRYEGGQSLVFNVIEEGLYEVYRSKERYVKSVPFEGWKKEMKLVSGMHEVDTVKAVVTVDRNYNITIVLRDGESLVENNEYAMTLTFKANVEESKDQLNFTSSPYTCENWHHGTKTVIQADGSPKEESFELKYDKNEYYRNETTISLLPGDIRQGV